MVSYRVDLVFHIGLDNLFGFPQSDKVKWGNFGNGVTSEI